MFRLNLFPLVFCECGQHKQCPFHLFLCGFIWKQSVRKILQQRILNPSLIRLDKHTELTFLQRNLWLYDQSRYSRYKWLLLEMAPDELGPGCPVSLMLESRKTLEPPTMLKQCRTPRSTWVRLPTWFWGRCNRFYQRVTNKIYLNSRIAYLIIPWLTSLLK